MANYTGSELLLQILGDTGAVLSPLQQHSLSARLQQMLDAGTSSDLQVAALIGSNPQIRASVPAGETPSTYLAGITEAAKAEISDSDDSVISVTASAESVDEGDSVDFIIQAADGEDALVEGTEIPYTITGISADDTDAALTGIAIIGADGTATITVMLKEDGVTEGEEIMTLRALGASAAVTVNDTSTAPVEVVSIEAATNLVVEGTSLEFTVTMDHAVDEDTTLTYQIQGIATSVAAPADPVADLGLLNGTVTILAGESTGTFTLTPADDGITEGFEAFKVVLLDENLEAGPDSGNILIKDAPNSGQTFTLTTGVDEWVGGAGNDTFNGIIDGTTGAVATTLTSLDTIDGGAGTDTFRLNVLNGNGRAGTAVAALPAGVVVQNVENAVVRTAVDLTADFSDWAGLTSLSVTEAAGDIVLTAEDTTAVTTSGTKGAITIDGGSDITVTDATAAEDITIGATTVNSGSITVTDTKVGAGTIKIDGGTDVTLTATGSSGGLDTLEVGQGGAATDLPSGAVTVTSNHTGVAATDVTLNAIKVTGGTTVEVTQTADTSKVATDTTGATLTQGAVTVTAGDSTTEVTVTQAASTKEQAYIASKAEITETASVKFGALKSGDELYIDADTSGALSAGDLQFTAAKDLTAAQVAQAFAGLMDPDTQAAAPVANGTYQLQAPTAFFTTWTSAAADGDTVVFTSTTEDADVANLVFNLVGTGTAPTVTTTDGQADPGKAGVLGVKTGDVTINDNATASVTTVTLDGYGATLIGTGGTLSKLETLNLSNSGSSAVAGDDNAAVTVHAAGVDTLALNVNNVQGNISLDGAADSALETLNIAATGDDSTFALTAAAVTDMTIDAAVDLTLTGTLTALKNATVSGAGEVGLAGFVVTTLETLDASANTGGVTASVNGNKTAVTGGEGDDVITILNPDTAISKAISLGAGDDKLDLTAATAVMLNPTVVIDGGDGTDIIALSSAAAVALTAGTTFQNQIAGFEKLELAAVTATGTVDLDNLDDINYVITNGNRAGFDLTLDNMLANATVELKAASAVGDDTIIVLADATGEADQVNLVANFAGNLGQVSVDAVETVAINVKANSTLTLDADAAETITVAGAKDFTLNLAAATTEVSLVDASTMTGDLTLSTLAGDTGATTVKGGSGDDQLTAAGNNDVLQGGAGDDMLIVSGTASAVTLTGGEGVDTFNVSGWTANNAGSAVTITDFASGEKIVFVANANAAFSSAQVTLIEEATFSEYVQEAAAQAYGASGGTHGIAWFNFNNNTFIVQDIDGDASFTDTTDIIVKLNGVYDLSTASYNDTVGSIEMA